MIVELLGGLIGGGFVGVRERRKRRARVAGLEQGEVVKVPCGLWHPAITRGQWGHGEATINSGLPTWAYSGIDRQYRLAGGALTLGGVREPTGREAWSSVNPELRIASIDVGGSGGFQLAVHPEELRFVLGALGISDAAGGTAG
ncbi:hypothetical protein GCM10009839_34820 [Catenulispora yoronensis]|uniref:Uncharacterized protein n=2 Tax=Catenulispora yoronensis TaxID=450799 RepID=A0ABP5FQW7_9ACTN